LHPKCRIVGSWPKQAKWGCMERSRLAGVSRTQLHGVLTLAGRVALVVALAWLFPPTRTLVRASLPLILLVAFVLLLFVIVLRLPSYLVAHDAGSTSEQQLTPSELLKAKNDVRTMLLQVIAGGVLVMGAFATWEQAKATGQQIEISERQYQASQARERRERATLAAEQLDRGQLSARINAINILEDIDRDSSEHRQFIVQVLSAYVRTHSPWPAKSGTLSGGRLLRPLQQRSPDLQAAVTMLGRRHRLFQLQACSTCLTLTCARPMPQVFQAPHFEHANLQRSQLDAATLLYINLVGARLQDASFQFADLSRANLAKADLRRADLRQAILVGANLKDAHLEGAQLQGANLQGAILNGAILKGAVASPKTRWPKGFDWIASGSVLGPL
jgi:Pentapeptide repeats (8 copies)